jgi:hypothetical protein
MSYEIDEVVDREARRFQLKALSLEDRLRFKTPGLREVSVRSFEVANLYHEASRDALAVTIQRAVNEALVTPNVLIGEAYTLLKAIHHGWPFVKYSEAAGCKTRKPEQEHLYAASEELLRSIKKHLAGDGTSGR